MSGCSHLGQIRVTALPPSIAGCEACLHVSAAAEAYAGEAAP